MQNEIIRSHAQALDDWSRQWSGEEREGGAEVANLLARASRLMRKVAGDVPLAQQFAGKAKQPEHDPFADDLAARTEPPLVGELREG